MKKLFRSRKNRVFAGVAGGLSEYFNIDPILIRLIFIILAIFGGGGLIIYLVMWLVVPENPDYFNNPAKDKDGFTDYEFVDDNEKKNNDTMNNDMNTMNDRNDTSEKKPKKDNYSTSKNVKRTGTFLGLFLILLGVFFGLKTMGLISFSWWRIWELWPLFFIFIGISMINMKNWLKNLLLLLILVFSLFWISRDVYSVRHSRSYPGYSYSYDYDYDDYDVRVEKKVIKANDSDYLELDIERTNNETELELNIGACELRIAGETDNLLDVYKSGERIRAIKMDNTTALQKTKFTLRNIGSTRTAEIKLNKKQVWDLDLNVGAADVWADLSDFKVRKLDIETGAANVDVKLGDRYKTTDVDIEIGVAKLIIRVPKTSACEVDMSSFAINRRLDGFVSENGVYRTTNFDTAANTIRIRLEGALSDFEIIRY